MPFPRVWKYLTPLLAAYAGCSGFLFAAAEAAESPGHSPPAIEVLVDGKAIEPSSAGFRIPASHKSVSVRLGTPSESSNQESRRMRFKLEGVDNDWRQISSEMSLMMRFGNAAGDQVGQHTFRASGTSGGWKGSIEKSSFTKRREVARVPAESAFVTAAISSSGPPTALGVYVVRDLKILRAGANGLEPIFAAASGDEPTEITPAGWSRSGTRPSMARMVRVGSGEAFCIVDEDPNAHAEWHSSRATAPAVQPGELLTVEWSEMHDIGMGNRFEVNYGLLGAGTYRFWTNEQDVMGTPLGSPLSIELLVLQPFWKSAWFLAGTAAVIGILLWLGFRAIMRRKIRQHLARAEHEHLVERERLRIARDLHDDLGVRLTHISLVSGLAENDPHSATAGESFQQISGMTRELVAALYQTVWTVNPENDHLEALINYLGQLTQNVCETARIRCRIHSCDVPSNRGVTSELRHNITLTVKEALHNAIKHAGATEITARMEFADPHLVIMIEDNGRGFDAATVTPGRGLENMRQRMELVGGSVSMDTSAGTRVRFEIRIPASDASKAAQSNRSVNR
jgi:signal transduction histidine kinase